MSINGIQVRSHQGFKCDLRIFQFIKVFFLCFVHMMKYVVQLHSPVKYLKSYFRNTFLQEVF